MNHVLLLDASAWLAAVDPRDPYHPSSLGLVEASAAGSISLAALDLTLYEVANVAAMSWRSPRAAEQLVKLIRLACPGSLEAGDEELLRESVKLAGKHDLTVYDAAYVAAAVRRGWTLVSGDIRDLVRPGLAVSPDSAAADL